MVIQGNIRAKQTEIYNRKIPQYVIFSMIIFNSVNYICHNRAIYFRILNTSIERIRVVASEERF